MMDIHKTNIAMKWPIVLLAKLFLCSFVYPCQLTTPTIILSAPLAHIGQKLKLNNDPQWKAVTSYAGLNEKDFSGEILPGGLFISPQFLKRHEGTESVVLFDESIDLRRVLSPFTWKALSEYKSRGLNPFQAVEEGIKLLNPYLKNCEFLIAQLRKEIETTRDLFRSVNKEKKKTMLFYLGKIEEDRRYPDFLMVNDGLVLFLLQEKLIESYPTDLAYVTWAEKNIKLMKNPLHIGLDASGEDKDEVKVNRLKSNSVYNFSGKFILTPGLGQILLLRKIHEFLF